MNKAVGPPATAIPSPACSPGTSHSCNREFADPCPRKGTLTSARDSTVARELTHRPGGTGGARDLHDGPAQVVGRAAPVHGVVQDAERERGHSGLLQDPEVVACAQGRQDGGSHPGHPIPGGGAWGPQGRGTDLSPHAHPLLPLCLCTCRSPRLGCLFLALRTPLLLCRLPQLTSPPVDPSRHTVQGRPACYSPSLPPSPPSSPRWAAPHPGPHQPARSRSQGSVWPPREASPRGVRHRHSVQRSPARASPPGRSTAH